MTRARRFTRAATIWGVVLASMAYWVFYHLMPYEQLIEWLRSSQIIVSVILVLVCIRGLYGIMAARLPHQALQLVLGIAVAATGGAINAGWFLLYRMADYPEWMLMAPINGFSIWLIIIGLFLHLTAPRSPEGDFPRENWTRICTAIVLSTALAVYVLIAPPDARGLAEWLKPYLA